jgi:hypothetical protein
MHTMSHSAAMLAKDKMPGAAEFTAAAHDSRGAEPGHSLSNVAADNVATHLDHCSRKLVTKYNRWAITQRIMQYVNIRTTDSAVRHLDLYLVVTAFRFSDLHDLHVSITGCEFHEGFHPSAPNQTDVTKSLCEFQIRMARGSFRLRRMTVPGQ